MALRFRRRLIYVAILAPALALGLEALIWLAAGRMVETAFADWVAARRVEGWQVAAGSERLVGWPLAAVVEVAEFSISGGRNLVPGGLEWRVDHLRLRLDLLAPHRLLLLAVGRQHFRIFDGPEFALTATRVEAQIPFFGAPQDAAGMVFAVTGQDVRAGPADLYPELVTARTLLIEAARSKMEGSNGSGAKLRLHASGVRLARISLPALGPRIGLLSLDAALNGPLPSGPDWAASLGAWRDHGGVLAVRDFSLLWGPLALGGTGRLNLDRELQPAGEGTARMVGYAATLDALAAAGNIGAGTATAAKAILMLLARPAMAGGTSEVDVPVKLQDRTLSISRIPVLALPAITWPDGS